MTPLKFAQEYHKNIKFSEEGYKMVTEAMAKEIDKNFVSRESEPILINESLLLKLKIKVMPVWE